MIKRILKISLLILLLFLGYVFLVLLHGTLFDYQPPDEAILNLDTHSDIKIMDDSIYSMAIWNVGYGGLGGKSDLFFDDGGFYTAGDKMVRSPRNFVEEYVAGAIDFIKTYPVDFYLFQEADIASKRSFYIDQYKMYQDALPGYASSFAVNYKVNRVPVPILQPWKAYGKTLSGLATHSRFEPFEAVCLQLPGEFDWPTKIFQLDRCVAIQRYKTNNNKTLSVYNIHISAYDKGGMLKKQQMAFLKELLKEEDKAGNYVVVGGDWNQLPPGIDLNHFIEHPKEWKMFNVPEDFVSGWNIVYDKNVPTNRSTGEVYSKGKSYVKLIDFYLVSPNIEIVKVQGVDQQFAFSDHQPVLLYFKLK